MDRPYIGRNDASRERLRQLVARLSDAQMNRAIGNGWTVSVVLAHLAFWDRFVLERWNRAERDGALVPPVLDDSMPDLINAAALPQWQAMPPSIAARDALEAAATVDRKIEELSPAATRAVLASTRLVLLDRSMHREPHLDEIEDALRPATGERRRAPGAAGS